MSKESWKLLEKVEKLSSIASTQNEFYERERTSNIRERYQLLYTALLVSSTEDGSLVHIAQAIAELGAEFQAGKTHEYFASNFFKKPEAVK